MRTSDVSYWSSGNLVICDNLKFMPSLSSLILAKHEMFLEYYDMVFTDTGKESKQGMHPQFRIS